MNTENLAYSNSSDSLIVKALCRDLLLRGVSFDISAADEMLRFFQYAQGHGLEQAVAMYLDSGHRIWTAQRQILAWRFGSLSWGGPILDFASGYGRVTRHIVADIPEDRVWVSDIYAGGVAFQERELGVHGIVSTVKPEEFTCDQRFDAILVSSLFTHLPKSTFIGWLRRLGSLLNPGGILLFSVHDISLYREGPVEPHEGIVFREISESGSLDTCDYGSSWVTESFVRSAVEEAIGTYPISRIPRGLASFQDLYVVIKEEPARTADFSGLKLKRDADGFLEHCSWTGKRSLRLSGWIADRVTGQAPREVRIGIDGELTASCRDLQSRPSLSSTFTDDPTEVAGWQITVDLPETANPESAHLSVWGISCQGEDLSLYSGPVSWACLRSAQLDVVMVRNEMSRQEALHGEQLEQQKNAYESRLSESAGEIAALTSRLRGMEASRFWKARNLWFRLKRALGLTEEQ
ncbi:MAG TPA: class I SAM-dependent methyltransferase [Thermoanaerobaculia bacterium]